MTTPPQAGTLSSAVIRRTVKLAEIPAPTGHEDTRRERVRSWWRQDGWTDVRTDDVGNLWARVRPGDGPAVVLAAHLDTVFDDTVDHQVRQEGTRLCGPSVGDDSVGVAALSALGTRAPNEQITVGIEELGRRPAGELEQAHPLAAAAAAALRAAGWRARFTAASTDANAAHVAGVPAIAIGVTTGGGEHTPDEWIDTSPLSAGLGCAAATIAGWEGGGGDRP